MAAKLRVIDSGETHLLEDFNLLGRSHDATIRLNDAGISRQHATIRREGRLFWITDLGSANGCFVNDVALSASRVLRHGDQIQLGTLILLFDQDDTGSTGELAGGKTQMLRTAVNLPVKTIEATLLVGDLKDFTRISTQLTAEEVAMMLREWYADCEGILKPLGAVIDKFIGDGVFAYWPASDPATRLRAAEAARLLSQPEAAHSPTRKTLRQEKGIVVQCNVGLNVGPVALGAMGRGVNTAVGEAVNVTFRIESLTRQLGVPVLAGSNFVQGLADPASLFEPRGSHPVKGQPDPVEVYGLREP